MEDRSTENEHSQCDVDLFPLLASWEDPYPQSSAANRCGRFLRSCKQDCQQWCLDHPTCIGILTSCAFALSLLLISLGGTALSTGVLFAPGIVAVLAGLFMFALFITLLCFGPTDPGEEQRIVRSTDGDIDYSKTDPRTKRDRLLSQSTMY